MFVKCEVVVAPAVCTRVVGVSVQHVLLCSAAGRLFGAAGETPFLGSTLSSAFPLVNHPAFGALYTTGAGRPEFGGLGSIGMSAALAAHPQLGALSGKKMPFCLLSSDWGNGAFSKAFPCFLRLVESCWSSRTGSRRLPSFFHQLPSVLRPSHSAQSQHRARSDQDPRKERPRPP